ncbi:MAG: hypothetical protein ACTSXP_06810 [Promethearchaeota archaeon]
MTYEVGTTGHNITWNPNDSCPAFYNVTRNGTLVESNSWNGSEISINIDGLSIGTHVYVCSVNDTSGHSVSNEVWVNVTASITIDHPEDIIYVEGESNNNIHWHPSSSNPSHYKIMRNDSIIENGIWDGLALSINVDFLEVGVYEFTCEVNDTFGNFVSDSVLVFVEYDDIKPNITGPDDFSYEFGTSNNKIVWNATDLNPSSYKITRDGELVIENTWNGSDIVLMIDGLDLGNHAFLCSVKDKNNNTAQDAVNVTIIDTTSPLIEYRPPNIEYEHGSSGHFITWTATDLLPDTYEVTLDGAPFESGVWNSGENITIKVDGLLLGLHFFICQVNDTSGNNDQDEVKVLVVDTTPPSINILENIRVEKGTKMNIIWSATDLNPLSFSIFCDGLLIQNGTWDNSSISLPLNAFPIGSYNITCVVTDSSGNSAASSVIVEIIPQSTFIDLNSMNFLIFLLIFGTICIGAVVSSAIHVYRRKKTSNKKNQNKRFEQKKKLLLSNSKIEEKSAPAEERLMDKEKEFQNVEIPKIKTGMPKSYVYPDQIQQLRSEKIEFLLESAEKFIEEGRYDEALQRYQHALELQNTYTNESIMEKKRLTMIKNRIEILQKLENLK